MSMNTYPLKEMAALIITGELAVLINSQTWPAADGSNPADMAPEELAAQFGDVSDAEEALNSRNVDPCFCSEFEGTASPLKAPDDTDDHDISFNDDYVVYIPCERGPSLFEAAYPNFEALVDEFRRKLTDAGYDITDFPLEDYVCELTGTYFC